MATRSYADSCGIARALDAVGDRWTLLVVRELVLGPKRYSDLQRGLGRIGPDVLAQRLRDLEQSGLVRRDTDAGPGHAKVYELTDRGHELEPVLHALGRFGSTLPMPPDAAALSVDAAVVALETTFRPSRAGDLSVVVQLVLDGDPVVVTVADGTVAARRGRAEIPAATLATSTSVLAGLAWHGRSLATAVKDGAAEVTGDRAMLRKLLGSFEIG
ncbi:winged helix-turn-helix transcriptional regulator [Jatrophihabitans fulvus]